MAKNKINQSIFQCTFSDFKNQSLHPSFLPPSRAKLEKMPSIPEEPEVLESEVEKRTMPDFVKPLADVEVIEGKEAVLKCKVAGLPYPTIVWYHNSKRIESSDERKMTQCKQRTRKHTQLIHFWSERQ